MTGFDDAGERDLALVTGVSGFIAGHVAAVLLAAGYRVRGTLRSLGRADSVKRTMASAGIAAENLSFAEADLEQDAGWTAAAEGCRFVHHVASPFPMSLPKNRMGLVPVAVDGTRRVLAAAGKAGAERVILTSSVAAVQYGHADRKGAPFTEADWSDVQSEAMTAYAISKTLAERAAWEAARDGGQPMVAINPGVVFGPLLGTASGSPLGTSATMIAMMMRGRVPLVPNVGLAVVDVRDVAAAHVAAMQAAEAVVAGRRFILSGGTRSMREIGLSLAKAFPNYAKRMPMGTLPDGLVRALAFAYPPLLQFLPELGARRVFDTRPAEALLQRSFRAPEEAAESMAASLLAVGRV